MNNSSKNLDGIKKLTTISQVHSIESIKHIFAPEQISEGDKQVFNTYFIYILFYF